MPRGTLELLSISLSPIVEAFNAARTLITAFASLIAALAMLQRQRSSRTIVPGIYAATWTHHDTQRTYVELVTVARGFRGIAITPTAYPGLQPQRYQISLKYGRKSSDLLTGLWSKDNREGAFQLRHFAQSGILVGRWIGGDEKDRSGSGDWFGVLTRSHSLFDQLKLRLSPLIDWLERRFIRFPGPAPMDEVIDRMIAAAQTSTMLTIDGTILRIPEGQFNPEYGSASRRLLHAARQLCAKHSRVLELGAGVGYIGISLAREFGCEVHGFDCDLKARDAARENAGLNDVASLCTFEQCGTKDMFSKVNRLKKYDLIVANLPFSRACFVHSIRNRRYADSFIGSRAILTQLMCGSTMHLAPGGRLLMTYGSSGYTDYFEWLRELSPLAPIAGPDNFKGKFDTTSVWQFSLSDHLRSTAGQLCAVDTDALARLMIVNPR